MSMDGAESSTTHVVDQEAGPVFPDEAVIAADPSVDDGSMWLGADDFTDPAARSRPPGPGLPEALGWMIGVILVHLIANIGLVLVLGTLSAVQHDGWVPTQSGLQTLLEDHFSTLLLGEMLIFALAAVVATRMRLGSQTLSRLNFQPIRPLHGIVLLALLFPVMYLSNATYATALQAWESLVTLVPMLRAFDKMNTVAMMGDLAGNTSAFVLFLAIAVGPAIGEEVVFRGVIGRGLLARHGLVAGILITTLLFALVHMHPVHVLGVVPLGLCIHFSYVVTRSFWAPMMIHFANNGFAVALLRMVEHPEVEVERYAGLSTTLLAATAALVAVCACGMLLWRTRIRYQLPDATFWEAGYTTLEAPPRAAAAVPVSQGAEVRLVFAAVAASGAFFVSLLWMQSQLASAGQLGI